MKRVHGLSAEQRPIWFEDAHENFLLILPFRHESPLPLKIWRESKSGFHVGCVIGNEWVGKNAQLPNHPRVMGSHSNLERYWDITGSLRFYWLTPYVESNILIKKLLEGKGADSSSLSEKFKQMTGGSSFISWHHWLQKTFAPNGNSILVHQIKDFMPLIHECC